MNGVIEYLVCVILLNVAILILMLCGAKGGEENGEKDAAGATGAGKKTARTGRENRERTGNQNREPRH